MPIKCTLVENEKKDGSGKYKCLEIQLTPTYKKKVFLLPSELALVELQSQNNR